MRFFPIILLFIASVFLISCSKDDDGNDFNYSKDNLLGKYSLVSLEMKEVITETIRGFEVTTTTESKGDTFDVRVTFDDNNQVTSNGTYRVLQKVTQNNQTVDSSYIVVLSNEKANYLVRAATSELEIGDTRYDVKDFNPRGFKISHEENTVNGDERRKFTIKMELKR